MYYLVRIEKKKIFIGLQTKIFNENITLFQQVARLKESVDLAATINNFNQSQIPEIVGLIVDPYLSQSPSFGQTMTQRLRNYVRQLLAIIIHCCQDGVQGFDAIVRSWVVCITNT